MCHLTIMVLPLSFAAKFCCSETGLLAAMASATQNSYTLNLSLRRPPNLLLNCCSNFMFCGRVLSHGDTLYSFIRGRIRFQRRSRLQRASIAAIVCSANKPSPSSEISSTAKIRSEVLSPFRSVRMFFYIAFVASGALGGLIASTRLIGALANASRAPEVPEILKGLGIDVGAVSLFAFLYYRESKAENAQLSRLSREESLSNLKLRVDEKKIIPVSSLRGIARLVICAGPASFITESFKLSEPFTESLLDRGVLVVPFVTDGNSPTLKFEESEEQKQVTTKRKRLWQLTPVYVSEWSEWLDEQKKLAGVSSESPVYLSLRLDGRVRGSGVGYPPWNALVAQLPPVKGIWTGLLDGMDGRAL